MRKVAVFDVDGTIFRSSLLIELVDTLIAERVFPKSAARVYAKAKVDWLDRKGDYEAYIMAVVRAFTLHIRGLSSDKLLRISQQVIDIHKHRTYRFTRELLSELGRKNYFLLAISNSPKDILDLFCREYGFDKVYGRMYELDGKGRFTGKVLNADLATDKAKLLLRAVAKENLTLKGSVGVGDTEADIPVLKKVDRAICFNPNKKMYQAARRNGWEIVVERKDMIYKLSA
ncbi:MAG: HAD-IB family phosphatase [Patescibacteria group bacterium]